MDVNALKSLNINHIGRAHILKTIRNELTLATEIQKKKAALQEQYSELGRRHIVLAESVFRYRKSIDVCNKRLEDFKQERLAILTESINSNLDIAYPGDEFEVKFVPSTYRGAEVIDLYSKRRRDTKWTPIHDKHGRMWRKVMGLSITTTIQLLLGCNILIMDEALNSGDAETTQACQRILQSLLDAGYQIILIEHKPMLYDGMARRQFNLHRDVSTNAIDTITVNDYFLKDGDVSPAMEDLNNILQEMEGIV